MNVVRALPSTYAFLFETARPESAGDDALMARAIDEARLGLGRTSPNPPVGAVVARDLSIVSTGFHARAGDRHGEIVALDAAPTGAAQGATLAVTLEPCVHHGRTPPCVDRVITERVGRVIVGAID